MKGEKEVYLTCKDYTVSNKSFDLLYNKSLDLLETFPQPSVKELPYFYKSEAYISHTDSKKSFSDKLYQLVKTFTLKNKLKLVNSFNTKEKSILDVGCGTGEFLLTCKKNGWNISGVEPSKNAKKLANAKLFKSDTSKIVENIEVLSNQQFDVITLWHVLEHVPNATEYISKLKMLLKPSGVLIVAVPNFKSFDALYYKKYWAAFDVPRHLWHFSKEAIHQLFSIYNFKVVKILPMYFDSFYVSLLSEKNKTGNSNLMKAFFVGLLSNLKAIRSKEYSSLIYILKNT